MFVRRFASPLFALALCVGAAHAKPARVQAPKPPPIERAQHVAILDFDSELVLECRECDVPMPPASMSKLMTMLVVTEKLKSGAIKPEQKLTVSENAWRHGAQSDGSHMFLPINGQVSVHDLIQGVIILSANDACIVLAEGIAGSEEAFVTLMNQRAQELGLASASFRNVTGLPDPQHVISARDLAKLAAAIIREQPQLYKLYAQEKVSLSDPLLNAKNQIQFNRNPLLGAFPGADGVKTGHVAASGYGLIGSAVQNGKRRIIVFNGAVSMADRGEIAKALMGSAFYDYQVAAIAKKGAVLGEAEVWLGSKKSVPLVAQEDILVGARRAVAATGKAEIVYNKPVPAPIKKGAPIAKLIVTTPDGAPRAYDLLAGAKVGKKNPVSRAFYGLGQLISGEE